ncbi:hypothetical protein ACFV80_37995 [Streptomyces sp. NPDC059862]|uniref:hypothetical protein n=1 Tax=Streptomyces sp. NPDC059862 TaxID=3346975 RepID=UPI00365956F8
MRARIAAAIVVASWKSAVLLAYTVAGAEALVSIVDRPEVAARSAGYRRTGGERRFARAGCPAR